MKKALLIGINYKGKRNELRGCINDIDSIKAYLLQRGYTLENIRVMTDNTPACLPTRKAILQGIDWLAKDSKAGDSMCFYYSGHGSRIMDYSGDELSGKDNVIVPIDANVSGIITDDEFRSKLVNVIPVAANLWAFFDCCNSGTMLDLKYTLAYEARPQMIGQKLPAIYDSKDWKDTYGLRVQRDANTNGSVYMFSGCLDPQTSADATIENRAQGAFTYCMLKCLTKKTQFGQTLRDVLKEVNCWLAITGFPQRSMLSVGKIEDINKPLNI